MRVLLHNCLRAIIGTLATALAFSGCASGVHLGTSEVVTDTKGAIAAFYMSPQSSTNWSRDGGYVALVYPDGNTKLFSTDGMDNGVVRWTRSGLFFADTQKDYIISDNGLTMLDSRKTDYQDGLVELDNGIIVGLYNGGWDDDQYVEQVVTNDGTSAKMSISNTWAPAMANCGNSVYSFLDDAGEILSSERSAVTLKRVIQDGIPDDTVITRSNSLLDFTDFVSQGLPCFNDEIVIISSTATSREDVTPNTMNQTQQAIELPCGMYSNGSGLFSCPTIERWNVQTGARVLVPILPPLGSDLNMSIENIGMSRYSDTSVQSGKIYWIHPNGSIIETNILTGESWMVAALELAAPNDQYRYLFSMKNGNVQILAVPYADSNAEQIELVEVAITSGKIIHNIPLNMKFHRNQIVRSFDFRGTE